MVVLDTNIIVEKLKNNEQINDNMTYDISHMHKPTRRTHHRR